MAMESKKVNYDTLNNVAQSGLTRERCSYYWLDGIKKGLLINSGNLDADIEKAVASIQEAKNIRFKKIKNQWSKED